MSNVIFFRINGFDVSSLARVCEHLAEKKDEYQEGIYIKEQGDSFLSGTFWVKKKRRVTYFDLEQQQYIANMIDVVDVAEIRLEISKNLLIIVGSRRMAQRCITFLSILLDNKVTVSERNIDLPILCRRIAQSDDIELLKAYLKDIAIADGILVNCNINLKNVEDAAGFISKYSDNIISIQLSNKGTNSIVTIKKNGSIGIGRTNIDDFDELLETLDNMLDKEQ